MISWLMAALVGTAPAVPAPQHTFQVGVVCESGLNCQELAQIWLDGASDFSSNVLSKSGISVKFESFIILAPQSYSYAQAEKLKADLDLLVVFSHVLYDDNVLGIASGLGVIGREPSGITIATLTHHSAYNMIQTVHHELGHIFGAPHTDDGVMFWQSKPECAGFASDSMDAIVGHLNSLNN